MSHGHTRIPTRGVCIYCGRTDVRLTNEHLVPLSLGGQHILEGASCNDCADVTKKFERKAIAPRRKQPVKPYPLNRLCGCRSRSPVEAEPGLVVR
jgi:hypothetical protein